jgi:hypothetical protein
VHAIAAVFLTAMLAFGGQAYGRTFGQGGPVPSPPDVQTDEQAAADAQATAEGLFDLAAAGEFNALYDRIHPDAKAVVPRESAVRSFEEVYALAQAGRAQVTGVRIGSWTWPVTDQAYPTAAEVAYAQPYVDAEGREQLLQTEMYLVPFEGAWRWFFGADRASVAELLGRFAPLAPPPPPSTGDIRQLLTNVVNDLDHFYRTSLASTEFDYVTPGVTVVDEGTYENSGCGTVQVGFYAFYCPGDGGVYLDIPFLQEIRDRYGDFAVAFVVGHEWAHHVQTVVELRRVEEPQAPGEVYSIELELMADCYTGVWTLDADTRNVFGLDSLANGVAFIQESLGDPEGIDPFDPRAHGSANARVNAFSDGYDDGFFGCELVV